MPVGCRAAYPVHFNSAFYTSVLFTPLAAEWIDSSHHMLRGCEIKSTQPGLSVPYYEHFAVRSSYGESSLLGGT